MSGREAVVRAELALAALAATALLSRRSCWSSAALPRAAAAFGRAPGARPPHGRARPDRARAGGGRRPRRALAARQLALHRRLRSLGVRERRRIGAHAAAIVDDARPVAFCAGLRRPGALREAPARRSAARSPRSCAVQTSSTRRSTRARRQPLRLPVAQTLADAFALRTLRDLPDRQHPDGQACATDHGRSRSPPGTAAAFRRRAGPSSPTRRPSTSTSCSDGPVAYGSPFLLACTLAGDRRPGHPARDRHLRITPADPAPAGGPRARRARPALPARLQPDARSGTGADPEIRSPAPVLMGLQFFRRGGSAHVARNLARNLPAVDRAPRARLGLAVAPRPSRRRARVLRRGGRAARRHDRRAASEDPMLAECRCTRPTRTGRRGGPGVRRARPRRLRAPRPRVGARARGCGAADMTCCTCTT